MARSKYHNRKVKRHGLIFDSQKEADRWDDLLQKQQAGKISELKRQVPFVLIPAQRRPVWDEKKGAFVSKCVEQKCSYVSDFVYTDTATGAQIVEDTKGFKTPEYIIKRKLMLERHNIRIKEV